MDYTIKQVAQISGVSTRTLRYYDEIGLLKPARLSSSGYRIYGQGEIDYLQQVLFYKYLGFDLNKIKNILSEENFSNITALNQHYQKLLQEREHIDHLLTTIEQTLEYYKGEQEMTNEQKFESFKKQQIQKNEEQYGQELRTNYGNEVVEASNKKYESLTETDMHEMKEVEEELFTNLKELTKLGNVENAIGKRVYELHKKWLNFTWASYSTDAHKGLADMYLADERFADYYNFAVDKKATQMLHDAIYLYA
ncbi:MerR family transcriptional regulator [Companilactobacillus sp. RD055328]|uniref:MerR family transcriptional regulator n=1 Tax=Companilactobacillus sp. RD055328 TaxID=2916634 RepID=UPI001FC8DB4C|nr:MerR family transcriptional regulator [Companilactobacillus sp. RD055328]GKQ43136.1 MerR family transcriptional regulator [Companilactobacillus sp. RD055328]